MTEREFDVAYTDASERALNANDTSERQTALSDIQALKKYEESGQIGLQKDVTWMVTVARFFIIVAILSLCWSLIVKIRKEFHKPKPLKLTMGKATYKKLFPNKERTLSELESQAHRLR